MNKTRLVKHFVVVGAMAGLGGAQALPAKPPRHPAPAKQHKPVTPVPNRNSVRGIAFHFCSCAVPCPCMFRDKDIEGCNIVKVYHYTDGGYIGKGIVDKTVVIVPYPKDLQARADAIKHDDKSIDRVIYLPAGSSGKAKDDLLLPILEMDMAFPFANAIQRQAKITFRKTADGYEVDIPGVFHAKATKALGADKKQIVADNLAIVEGARLFLGHAPTQTYQDGAQQDWKWNLKDGNGSWTFFRSYPHEEGLSSDKG